MSSILSGFEYDIFVSYRQKDNKGEHWVTEFVSALKTELEATFKEDISIYFDTNPYDGLLETHNVDKSLEGKLKCLIFIPIVSQTYCDPKSFAWQQEFCAFNRTAKEDQLGRDIRLSNGNVASRILPVKIHDLDAEDKALFENELGGMLRAIEFIYKSAGVNRPLKPNDDRIENLNHTYYRDQINKVANAIKEIMVGLKTLDHPTTVHLSSTPLTKPYIKPRTQKMLALTSLAVLIVLLTGYILLNFTRVGTKFHAEPLNKSIAVLPFVDMSPGHNQEYFADGLSEELLNLLSQVPGLKVIGRTSSFQFKGKNEDLREIGKKLDVTRLLEGSVRKSETSLRITAQLIDTQDGSHVWSKTYDRKFDDIFAVQDEIAASVVEALKINLLTHDVPTRKIPVSAEAYNLFMQGKAFYDKVNETEKAMFWFKESIKLDSTFALPWTYLSMCYWRYSPGANSAEFKEAKKAAAKALELDPTLGTAIVNMAEILDNEYDFEGAAEKIELALKVDPTNTYVLRNAGRFYTLLGRQEVSISFCRRALQNDPINTAVLLYLTIANYCAGRYAETEAIINKNSEIENLIFSEQFNVQYLTMLEQGKADEVLKKAKLEKSEKIRLFAMAAASFKLGNKKEGDRICIEMIAKFADSDAYLIALTYAHGDDQNKVCTWLERSYANKEKFLTYMKVQPTFKNFRNEPRFRQLLQKMKFPE